MNESFWRKLTAMGKMYSVFFNVTGSSQYTFVQLKAGVNIILLKDLFLRFNVATPLLIGRRSTVLSDSVLYANNLNPKYNPITNISGSLNTTSQPWETRMYLIDLPANTNIFLDFSKAPILAQSPESNIIISSGVLITGNMYGSLTFGYLTVDEFNKYM